MSFAADRAAFWGTDGVGGAVARIYPGGGCGVSRSPSDAEQRTAAPEAWPGTDNAVRAFFIRDAHGEPRPVCSLKVSPKAVGVIAAAALSLPTEKGNNQLAQRESGQEGATKGSAARSVQSKPAQSRPLGGDGGRRLSCGAFAAVSPAGASPRCPSREREGLIRRSLPTGICRILRRIFSRR